MLHCSYFIKQPIWNDLRELNLLIGYLNNAALFLLYKTANQKRSSDPIRSDSRIYGGGEHIVMYDLNYKNLD